MNDKKCPVCESEQLIQIEEKVPLKAGDVEREMVMHAIECASCGCSFHTPEQERFNKRQRLAFRKHVEGLLPGEQIKAIRQRHGLTQKQAAEIFGGGPVAFAKYEADDVAQSQAMDRLIRVFDEVPAARFMLMGEVVPAPQVQLLIENQLAVGYHIEGMLALTAVRRRLNAEEDVRERLVQMLTHTDGKPEVEYQVEWQAAGKPASEWRH